MSVAGGGFHSLGLKADGSIVCWGRNNYGQCNIPSPNQDFLAIAGGSCHSIGLQESETGVDDDASLVLPPAVVMNAPSPNPFST